MNMVYEGEDALIFGYSEDEFGILCYVVIAPQREFAYQKFVNVMKFEGTSEFINGRYEASLEGHFLDGYVEVISEDQPGYDSAVAMCHIAQYGNTEFVEKAFNFMSLKWT